MTERKLSNDIKFVDILLNDGDWEIRPNFTALARKHALGNTVQLGSFWNKYKDKFTIRCSFEIIDDTFIEELAFYRNESKHLDDSKNEPLDFSKDPII